MGIIDTANKLNAGLTIFMFFFIVVLPILAVIYFLGFFFGYSYWITANWKWILIGLIVVFILYSLPKGRRPRRRHHRPRRYRRHRRRRR